MRISYNKNAGLMLDMDLTLFVRRRALRLLRVASKWEHEAHMLVFDAKH